jgi:RNA-directed DNA polymerase
LINWKQEKSLSTAKPFCISKRIVWDAYKRVKANKGAAGVDEESIEEFERKLEDNLYRLWNKMSSGSYFPPPVRMCDIPKGNGKQRTLGIPTVSDRIAQMVVKMYIETDIDKHFHPDSYGYRPGKSAEGALEVARQRCWKYDYVIDLDIKQFFDSLDHELILKALRKHTDSKWVLLHVGRWLKAPGQDKEGLLITREKGTPQGGVISPLLANLFLHYAFDLWMSRHFPQNPFERYADDVVVHCRTEQEAVELRKSIEARLADCKLEVHPEKTKIVYCKDDKRKGEGPNVAFDFLGYTFRPRVTKTLKGKFFVGFNPAVSSKSKKKMTSTMRKWRIHLKSDRTLLELSKRINPVVRGWVNYYGIYCKSEMYSTLNRLNVALARWAERKYKRLRSHMRRAMHWLGNVAKQNPVMFVHWQMKVVPAAG